MCGIEGDTEMDRDQLEVLSALESPAFLLGPDGVIAFGNAAWTAMVGDTSTAAGWEWLVSLSDDDRERVKLALQRALAEEHSIDVEFHVGHTGGPVRVLSVVGSPFRRNGNFVGLIGVCWDVTERRRRERRLEFIAGHDQLTGLASRRAFEETLARASSRAARGVQSMLLYLDIDHLKAYNDERGHLEGDQAIINLAMLLHAHVRASDVPARIGGDEFAILLENATADEANEIAERIRAAASIEFVAGARAADLGVSGGLARVEGGVDPRIVMDRADAALYAAKQRGRHRIVVWDEELGGMAMSHKLATPAVEALAHDRLHLVFQPVVRLGDGSVAYYESLVRLVDDERTLLPVDFLPVLERLGLLTKLTRRVLAHALEALAQNAGVTVSINLSASDLTDETLLADVEEAILSSGIDPARLVFEIPEPTLVANLADGRTWMDRLSRAGCRFVLDDFGTGLGVFMLLRDPHVEQVKLSREVVCSLTDSVHTRAFVSAVRELIEAQGKVAVAAFLETDEMLGEVRAAGFGHGQGFCLAEPSRDLSALVAAMDREPY